MTGAAKPPYTSSPYFSLGGNGVTSSSSIRAQGDLLEYDRLANFLYSHPMADPATTTATRTAMTIPTTAPVDRPSDLVEALSAAMLAMGEALALETDEGVCVMVRTVAVEVVGATEGAVEEVEEERDDDEEEGAVEEDREEDYGQMTSFRETSLKQHCSSPHSRSRW